MKSSTAFLLQRAVSTILAIFIFCCTLTLLFSSSAFAGSNAKCLWCHTKEMHTQAFPESAHAVINCGTCHQGIEDVYLHKAKLETSTKLACVPCHKDVEKIYKKDVHFTKKKQGCLSCHREIHTSKKSNPATFKADVVASCIKCHEKNKDMTLGHAAALLKGNKDSASCVDCHTLHRTKGKADKNDKEAMAAIRLSKSKRCISCHSDPGIVERSKLNPAVVKGFSSTYHGKAIDMGFGKDFAGCIDCHTGHVMLPASNPQSPVHPDNRAETCGKCHKGFAKQFTSYIAHPDYTDSERFPLLFWSYTSMEGLLFSVFAVFGIHTLLWWRKAYWSNWTSTNRGEAQGNQSQTSGKKQYVQRFGMRYRIMHILLIASFMILVITGMPLKFHEANWARIIMDILGGPALAAIYHRAAATVMIIMFLYVCWVSLKYLFLGQDGAKGWTARLFGPESLCPNLKDWQDIKGMFRWFIGKGERPRFERWTYFEKFDFFAVFWGMAIIGGSGIVMWFPEQLSFFLPGWLINVASIVHSEEALLAAVFIFTVHFFHNHLAPGKFPMEDNVFTGRYTMDEFKHERPDEYDRVVAEGRLEEIKAERPGIGIKLFSAVYGYGAVFLGISLTCLIIWAICR